jgi:hypothetical protein
MPGVSDLLGLHSGEMLNAWMVKGGADASAPYTPTAGLYDTNDPLPLTANLVNRPGLIDADKTTGNYICHDANNSWGVDLGSSKQISKVVFYFCAPAINRTAFYSDPTYGTMRLYSSDDNSNWTKIGNDYVQPTWENVSNVGSTTCFSITITPAAPITARYIKGWTYYLADNAGTDISICEVEVWS